MGILPAPSSAPESNPTGETARHVQLWDFAKESFRGWGHRARTVQSVHLHTLKPLGLVLCIQWELRLSSEQNAGGNCNEW